MYCEYLLKQCKDGDKESEGEFFLANYGLIFKFAKDFHVNTMEMDDFVQICYLAFKTTVNVYHPDVGNSFLSFYRRSVFHEYYLWKLETHYPVKIPKDFYKQVVTNGISVVPFENCDYMHFDGYLTVIEDRTSHKMIWQEVLHILGYTNCKILWYRFKKGFSHAQIVDSFPELGLSCQQLRSKQNYLLRKLRKSRLLQVIAYDYFEINTKD